MLSESGLPDVAADLRVYIEEGIQTGEDQRFVQDGLYRDREITRRRRSRKEQIRDAITFIREQALQPAQLIFEAEHLAGALDKGPGKRRPIYLVDMRFDEPVRFPAVTDEQLEAVNRVSELLPAIERMLLGEEGLRDGE